MPEADVEAAVERITEAAAKECIPDRMTQQEAIEFYQGIASDAATWITAIQYDIDNPPDPVEE